MFTAGKTLPKVEQPHIAKLSRQIGDHGGSDGTKSQLAYFEKSRLPARRVHQRLSVGIQVKAWEYAAEPEQEDYPCLLYTSDAADD